MILILIQLQLRKYLASCNCVYDAIRSLTPPTGETIICTFYIKLLTLNTIVINKNLISLTDFSADVVGVDCKVVFELTDRNVFVQVLLQLLLASANLNFKQNKNKNLKFK